MKPPRDDNSAARGGASVRRSRRARFVAHILKKSVYGVRAGMA